MCKYVIRLAMTFFATLLVPIALSATAFTPFLSFAENPVRLLRNTDFYLVTRGTLLQSGDIIDSAAADLQLECGTGCTAALGPGSRAAIHFDANGVGLILLSGWLKVQSRITPSGGAVVVRSMDLQMNASGCSFILHKTSTGLELFVESGHPSIEELNGTRVVRQIRAARDPYAIRVKGAALAFSPRAPKEFIRTMPPIFLNMLLPLAVSTARPSVKRERSANAGEIEAWRIDEPTLRGTTDRRFQGPKRETASAPGPTERQSKARLNELRNQELARIRTGLETAKSKPAAPPKTAPAPAPEPAPSPAQEQ